jgi:hypothetical protein
VPNKPKKPALSINTPRLDPTTEAIYLTCQRQLSDSQRVMLASTIMVGIANTWNAVDHQVLGGTASVPTVHVTRARAPLTEAHKEKLRAAAQKRAKAAKRQVKTMTAGG